MVPFGALIDPFGLRGLRGWSVLKPRAVAQDVVAVLGEPAVVPVVLVGAVALVGGGLPLVLVVSKAVEHHDQWVAAAAVLHRLRQVHVHRRAVDARDRAGADAHAAVRAVGALGRAGGREGGRKRGTERAAGG